MKQMLRQTMSLLDSHYGCKDTDLWLSVFVVVCIVVLVVVSCIAFFAFFLATKELTTLNLTAT